MRARLRIIARSQRIGWCGRASHGRISSAGHRKIS